MKSTITKRWVQGSLFFTILLVILAEGLFVYFSIDNYYKGARNAIDAQFNLLTGQLSGSSYSQRIYRRTVEQFDNKSKFELMMLNADGKVEITSSGVLPLQTKVPADVAEVLRPGGSDRGEFIGENENGEKIMAVTQLTPYPADDIVAMRLITSLESVDEQLYKMIGASVAVLFFIILASIVSGIYFIRSIVMPLRNVEETAARIARGDFDIRVEYKNNDEIGSLCKTINNMAEELSRSERMKNEFISSVSHELRTPLTSIKGWTETVGQLEDMNDPRFKRGLSIVAGEADRLYDMVEELLDFSRMQDGLKLNMELLDLAAEVEDACIFSGQRALNEDIGLVYEAPELPVPVKADKNRLRQALINVIDNALKYSESGQQVLVEILQDGQNAFVIVSDEGPGIAEDDLENIKVKFYKGKGALRGSGIGLAMADEIMTKQNGSLEITSELGKGTEVTMRFPLHSSQQEKKNE